MLDHRNAGQTKVTEFQLDGKILLHGTQNINSIRYMRLQANHTWHSPCNSEVTSDMFHRIFALTPKKRHILSMIKRKVFKLQSSATMR